MVVIGTGSLPFGYVWAEKIEPHEEAQLTATVWPNYLIEESDFQEPPPESQVSKEELHQRYVTWGIRENATNSLVAFASAVLIPTDPYAKSYPDEGWNYAAKSYYLPGKVKCLCLLSANIEPRVRGHRFSVVLLEEAKSIASQINLDCVLAPVRPTQKADFSELNFQDYLDKKNDAGEIFDPWLRTHAKLGGEILNVCESSVVIRASLERWEHWLKQPITSQAIIIPPRGFVPLIIDEKSRTGIYREPNVWVRYKI